MSNHISYRLVCVQAESLEEADTLVSNNVEAFLGEEEQYEMHAVYCPATGERQIIRGEDREQFEWRFLSFQHLQNWVATQMQLACGSLELRDFANTGYTEAQRLAFASALHNGHYQEEEATRQFEGGEPETFLRTFYRWNLQHDFNAFCPYYFGIEHADGATPDFTAREDADHWYIVFIKYGA